MPSDPQNINEQPQTTPPAPQQPQQADQVPLAPQVANNPTNSKAGLPEPTLTVKNLLGLIGMSFASDIIAVSLIVAFFFLASTQIADVLQFGSTSSSAFPDPGTLFLLLAVFGFALVIVKPIVNILLVRKVLKLNATKIILLAWVIVPFSSGMFATSSAILSAVIYYALQFIIYAGLIKLGSMRLKS